jgi:rubrerythrin
MSYYQYGGLHSRTSGCGCSGRSSGPAQLPVSNVPSPFPHPNTMTMPTHYPNYGMMPTHYPVNNMPMLTQTQYLTQPNMMPMTTSMNPAENLVSPQDVLRLLEDAVSDEKEDEICYNQLLTLAPTKVEKEIIAEIREDELAHFNLLRQIYRELTGKEIGSGQEVTPDKQQISYVASLRKALFKEMTAVEKYRTIRAGLSSRRHRDILFNIITDELIHQGKYNYLITSNRRS